MAGSVLLGFSGGMDSVTASRLLKLEGYDVTALTLDMFGDESFVAKARSCAQQHDLPFLSVDVSCKFKSDIIDYFSQSYLRGRTPAPCTMCNSLIKWHYLLSEADKQGFDYIATGHYFSIEQYNNHHYVARAADPAKDQSYYLWGLGQEVLSRALTPMSLVFKSEIKQSFKNKSESMGLCFLRGLSYRDFICENYPTLVCEGQVVDKSGREVGRHQGVAYYTIGQRRGLDTDSDGWAVVDIDAEHNRLIVGHQEDLFHAQLEVKNCNIVDRDELLSADDISVVVRGLGRNPQGYMRRVEVIDGGYRITLSDPAWAPAIGQPLVFYRQNRVIGGGIVEACL